MSRMLGLRYEFIITLRGNPFNSASQLLRALSIHRNSKVRHSVNLRALH